MTTTCLDDGNWYKVTTSEGEEPCIMLQVTSLDVWLSPAEARALAVALLESVWALERAGEEAT